MRGEQEIRAYFAELEQRSRDAQSAQATAALNSPSSNERIMALERWQQICLVLGTLQWVLGGQEQRY